MAAKTPDLRKRDVALLRTVQRLAKEGRWNKVLKLAGDRQTLQRRPRLLQVYLLSALQARNAEAIETALATLDAGTATPGMRMSCASRLIDANRPDDAWAILKKLEGMSGNFTFLTLAGRVAHNAKHPDARAEARKVMSSAVILAPEGRLPSDLRFAEGPVRPHEPGTVSLVSAARTSRHHEKVLAKLLAQFAARLQEPSEATIYECRDVFVNRFGQIWKPDGRIVRSFSRPISPIPEGTPVVEIDEGILCTDGTKGFYHWLADRLPTLAWRFSPGAEKLPILFGSHASSFQFETLRLLGVPREEVVTVGAIAYCKRVVAVSLGLSGMREWERVAPLYDALIASAAREAGDVGPGTRLYISRRDTDRRVMANEVQLEEALAGLGFESKLFSQLTLAQQITQVRQSEMIVAPHGAGLAHLILARPGTKVLEAIPSSDGSHSLRFNFARISYLRGHRYTAWLEPVNVMTKSWSVDLPPFIDLAGRIAAE